MNTQNAQKGKVYLVGAGPGDPELLTLKGKRCLESADAILYDSLANVVLLEHAPSEAERIHVGKRHGQHYLNQAGIHQLMIERAQQGKTVVRLKGGDPLIFGRGGEEALALAQAGIPFEIVPGISSAVAAPAYAGVPLTHRKYASSVAIVTGHRSSSALSVDWSHLATGVDTLVILMGMTQLADIADALIQSGRAWNTPTCVIEWGTLPKQRTVVAPLQHIATAVTSAGLNAPGVIIVGDVVSLRDELRWFQPDLDVE